MEFDLAYFDGCQNATNVSEPWFYYVNDPYGSLNDNYTGPVTNGKKTVYTKAVLKHRWAPNGSDGWGRIFD